MVAGRPKSGSTLDCASPLFRRSFRRRFDEEPTLLAPPALSPPWPFVAQQVVADRGVDADGDPVPEKNQDAHVPRAGRTDLPGDAGAGKHQAQIEVARYEQVDRRPGQADDPEGRSVTQCGGHDA